MPLPFGDLEAVVAAFLLQMVDDGPSMAALRSAVAKLKLGEAGGVLVEIYQITTAPAALQIGASASALVLALSKKESLPG